MAVTYRLDPGAVTYPGATTYPGLVGVSIVLKVLIDLGDPTSATPNWEYLPDDSVRGFQISRGRDNELAEIDAGTGTLTLDNRARDFDPTFVTSPYYPHIRPLTRFWVQYEMDGVTYSRFRGYAESYDQTWPEFGTDAVCTIKLADEFKVLSLDELPAMNPPLEGYADVVKFDNPTCYWRMDDSAFTLAQRAEIGPDLSAIDDTLSSSVSGGAIVGDSIGHYVTLPAGARLATPDTADDGPEDIGGTTAATMELWFKHPGGGASTYGIFSNVRGVGPVNNFLLSFVSATGAIQATARNSGGTSTDVQSLGGYGLFPNVWCHIVAVADGTNLTLYQDGVQMGQAAHSGVFENTLEVGARLVLGDTNSNIQFAYDEVALYRYALPPARILAHYEAGAERGYSEQRAGNRIGSVLNTAGSVAARSLMLGVRDINPLHMRGQSPHEAIRHALLGENVDGMFFIASDGTITFLDASHRTGTSYEIVQATFDDDGTDLSYHDFGSDYSETFLFNEINATREGGLTQTVSDATSIDENFKRPHSLTGLPVRQDSDALAIATALLAKYKDPMERIISLMPNMSDLDVASAVLPLDLGDRIRVFFTPPGGGARIDQTLWIQKIEETAIPIGAGSILPRVTLGVSPL